MGSASRCRATSAVRKAGLAVSNPVLEHERQWAYPLIVALLDGGEVLTEIRW